jgi:Phosphotransferase enzyme family
MTSVRPFVDRPVVDRDGAQQVAIRQAADWGLPRPRLLRHGMNSLFVCGAVVLRVGAATAPADVSHALVRWLRGAGVPTVAPIDGLCADVDGLAITGWERVDAVDAPIDWEAIGRAVRIVHDLPVDRVPTGYPLPVPTRFPWWDFDTMLADVAGEVDAPALDGIRVELARGTGWRERVAEGAVLNHGDVHPGNVLVSADGSLLIDWDLMCVANPAWDHAMLTTYATRWGGDPGVFDRFTTGYGEPAVDPEFAAMLGELRNVAATLMRVKAGRDDPAAAVEAERRLRYWRGDPRAPTWRAQ